MASLNENIEKLINRRLDGASNIDEELELDRELLRNPEARRVLEECRQIDRIAAVALAETVAATDAVHHVAPARRDVDTQRWALPHWWVLVPGAVAAALLALVIPRPAILRQTIDPGKIVSTVPVFPRSASGGMARTVSFPASVKRDTGREVIGVVDDAGSIYWIEVDRTWTVRQDPWSDVPPTVTRNPSGGLY